MKMFDRQLHQTFENDQHDPADLHFTRIREANLIAEKSLVKIDLGEHNSIIADFKNIELSDLYRSLQYRILELARSGVDTFYHRPENIVNLIQHIIWRFEFGRSYIGTEMEIRGLCSEFQTYLTSNGEVVDNLPL